MTHFTRRASFRWSAAVASALVAAVAVVRCASPPPARSPGGAPAPRSAAAEEDTRAPQPVAKPTPSSTVTSPEVAPRTPPVDPAPKLRGGGKKTVRGEHGMVVSVEANATLAGVRILEEGGNATDAAVAVGYALAVTHPSAGNLGGGGLLLVRNRASPTAAIDFREQAPAAVTQDAFNRMIERKAVGAAAVGVPGTVAGLNLAHSRYGRLPLAQVIAPAIELAEKGFALPPRQALTIRWAWPALKRDPAAAAIFGKGGAPKAAGERLIQRDLARTLRRIAERGDEGFYGGETAAAIVASMKPDGLVSLDDLRDYRASIRSPLTVAYRGLTVEIAPPPSAGGVAVAQMLLLRERLAAYRLPAGSAGELHLFVEGARRAHATRRFDVVDPESVKGYDLVAKYGEWLDADALLARYPAIDPERATPSSEVHPLYSAAVAELENTTHYAVADGEGGVVTCTTTLSAGFGAKIVAAGAGVVLNNSLAAFGTVGASVLAPRRKMPTSMSPALLLDGGEPIAALGSPGGDTIPNTVVQVLRNLVDYSMPLDEAVDAPRLHHGFVPDEIRIEGARPPAKDVLADLVRRGHRLSDKRLPIGDANNLVIVDGVFYGYADPREGGLALAPRRPER